MRDLVLAYFHVLRGVLRTRSDLRPCLVRCWHCRIFFLADPRNRGRKDLGCPFGCREAHRRKCSAERSAAYYKTASGKRKKASLNGNRRRLAYPGSESEAAIAPASEAIGFDLGIVKHVQMVISLIEGFAVSLEEVVAMLETTVRQRSIVRERRVDYVLRWLAEHFP